MIFVWGSGVRVVSIFFFIDKNPSNDLVHNMIIYILMTVGLLSVLDDLLILPCFSHCCRPSFLVFLY